MEISIVGVYAERKREKREENGYLVHVLPHAIALYFFSLLLFHFAVLVHLYKSAPFMTGA